MTMSGWRMVCYGPGHDVVDLVRVDRRVHFGRAGLHRGQEAHQPGAIVALRESPSASSAGGLRARAFGKRKPSVVTRSTAGWSGQRASSARRMRDVVLFPTATEPATPMMNGTRADSSPRNVDVARCTARVAEHVEAEQPRQREVDVDDLVEREDVVEAAQRRRGRHPTASAACWRAARPTPPGRR